MTELVFILDRSGSMTGLEADTIGGFNSMIARQKQEAGEALVSTVLFDNESMVIHDRLPLAKMCIRDRCYRQWYFSADTKKSVDMVLVLNGIPVFAFELKNQYTGQTVDDAKRQWMYDRDPRELCFQFNKRILAYFCVDHTEVWMTTKLAGKNTYFLPFNQGSNGAGNDGGKGNPANPNGYPTAYLWENVFQKDSICLLYTSRALWHRQYQRI